MIDAPTSTVTFLFADAGDSVSSQENRSTWGRDVLTRHNQILRKAVEDSGGSVSHPNIVHVYDRAETEDGSYYIAMEYIPGGNLKERIREKGPLPAEEAVAR